MVVVVEEKDGDGGGCDVSEEGRKDFNTVSYSRVPRLLHACERERDKGGCRWVRVRGVQKVWTQR